jgi:succinoglycan biosynthesis transport protein ExoP
MATRVTQSEVEFGLSDLLAAVRRRLWWFVVPSLVGLTVGLVLAMTLPAEYEADSRVVIIPQDIPADLVSPTVQTDTEAQFGLLKNFVLARDSLIKIITDPEHNLYQDLRGEVPMEDIVIAMREKITIEALPPEIVDPRAPVEVQLFRIAFRSDNPKTAAKVANRLRSDLLSFNLNQRAEQAEGTSEFLENEVRRAMEDHSRALKKLSEYKEEHVGELPEDLPTNQRRRDDLVSEVSTSRLRIAAAQEQIQRIKQQIDDIRLSGLQEQFSPAVQKKNVELKLSMHRARGKTDKHPDVVIALAELEELEILIQSQEESDQPISPQELGLRRELRQYEVSSGVTAGDFERLAKELEEVDLRVLNTPRRAAELAELQAEVEAVAESIVELQQKKAQADMGVGIELAQKGEKYRAIDTAVPPTAPISPNRPLVFVVGAVVGILLGVLLASLREMLDQSFHTPADLQRAFQLPVLGTIPQIELQGPSGGVLARFTPWSRR